jgi:plastocyanin
MTTTHDQLGTGARLCAAAALLVGGLVHLQLYFDGYRNLPDANLGRSFVLNGVASIVVAAALVWRRDAIVRLAGIAVVGGTLVAFALSRTGDGVFGLRETGLEPSPQALIALAAEVLAFVTLAATFLPAVGSGAPVPRRIALATSGVFVAGAIVLTTMWAQADHTPVAAASAPGAVVIADFAFADQATTVTAGSTVTWTNTDAFAHSVIGADGSFTSEPLATGDAFAHTFDAPGTFAYICGIHPSMTGSVVVTG